MFVCAVCVSMLLSRAVLSKLYQDKLVTEDEVERMKGEGTGLFDKLVLVQCTKPPELVARSANVLDKYGYNEEARKLRGWWGSQTYSTVKSCICWACLSLYQPWLILVASSNLYCAVHVWILCIHCIHITLHTYESGVHLGEETYAYAVLFAPPPPP